MNLEQIKEIEEQIDYHLKTHDEATEAGDNGIAVKCIEVITSLLSQLNENTINLRTDTTVQ